MKLINLFKNMDMKMGNKIVLIVGPSGVGKDTLLKSIKGEIKANFITRYITRKPDENEANYYIDDEAFEFLDDENYFISTWEAHENRYGIATSHIKKGLNIISVSRGVIKDFEDRFDDVTTISITIPKDELFKRLKNRAREDEKQIEKRVQRCYQIIDAKNLIEFDNSKTLDESVKDFIQLVKSL